MEPLMALALGRMVGVEGYRGRTSDMGIQTGPSVERGKEENGNFLRSNKNRQETNEKSSQVDLSLSRSGGRRRREIKNNKYDERRSPEKKGTDRTRTSSPSRGGCI